VTAASSITTPAALAPAFEAAAATSSSEAAATLAMAATSSRSAISPVLMVLAGPRAADEYGRNGGVWRALPRRGVRLTAVRPSAPGLDQGARAANPAAGQTGSPA